MQDASQQQTKPISSHFPSRSTPTSLTRGAGNAAFGASAAGLGLLAGVALALAGCHTTVAPAPPKPAASEPVAQTAQPPAPSAPPAPNPAPEPPPVTQHDAPKKARAARKPLPSIHKASAAKPSETDYEPVQPAPRRELYLNKYATGSTPAKRAPYVPQSSPASGPKATSVATIDATSLPFDGTTALQLATAAAAAGPFVLCIEGDVTVANYDVASGTVETFERETYVLSSPASDSDSIPWQDFPFNIHYRCDGTGNCTLYHGRAFASAKLLR